MPIKVFYIPPGYRGSTELLLTASVEKIRGPDYSKILYIAPTPRKVRDSQRIFHEFTRGCYIPPEMVTIKQLSKRLYSLYGDRKVISQRIIPVIFSHISGKGIGFASLITDLINEIKQYHPGKEIENVKKELEDIFYELHIPEEVSIRAMEALNNSKTYQEILERGSVLDEDDVMVECPYLIKEHSYRPEVLIVDGFYELTGSEELILKTLIENAKDTSISIFYDNKFSEISSAYIYFINNNFKTEELYLSANEKIGEPFYHPYPGIEEEVEGIARCIKHYFISGKIRDLDKIMLTFPKIYEYSDMVERIFRRYGIPYTISISKPAGKTRPFLDLIALLESVDNDYPRLPFSQFLTSPYFRNLPSEFREWIPSFSIRSGIIKGKDAWFTITEPASNNVTAFSKEIEKGLRWVFKKLAPLESSRNNGTFGQYSEIISKLLSDLGFSGLASHEEDPKEKAITVLRELSYIDHLTSYAPYTLSQFIDALRHILNVTETEIEGTGVQVMGYLELRGIEPEYLYFGGLKEGDLPSKPDIDHILPDSVRTKFGLVNLKKYLLLQEFIFSRTIQSTKNLHLSYPIMEAGRLFLPSPFLPWNKKKEERVSGIFSKEEESLSRGRKPLTSSITEIGKVIEKRMRNKFGENSSIRVTDIDSYRTCPRKFFIEKVLNLEPLETKEYKIEATLLGTIIHEIMHLLLSESFVDPDDFRVKAEEIMERILLGKPLENYWKNVIRDSFFSVIPELYELERSLIDDGYSFMSGEFPVEGEIVKGIRLKGKIDRIDRRVTNVVELIDYKTGTTQFRGSEVVTKGATLQLFIYSALIELLGFKVERVGIYSLKDVNLSWIPGKSEKKNGRTIEDYIEASLRFLKESVSKMRMGDFSAIPLSEHTCRTCSERPYCPYIQSGVKNNESRVFI